MLSFSGSAVSFQCGRQAVHVPSDWAALSQLLTDLRQENDAAKDIGVPLSMEALKAWHAFLEADRKGVSGGVCGISDTTLLHALEVCLCASVNMK